MSPKVFLRLPFGIAMAVAVGCGGNSSDPKAPDLVPVTGQVMLDGKPGTGIAVSFLPKDSTIGQGAYCVSDGSGSFQCAYPDGKPGCPAGTYKVIFSKLALPDGSPIPDGKTAADSGARDMIPMRYRALDTIENVVTVQSMGKNEFKFEIMTQ